MCCVCKHHLTHHEAVDALEVPYKTQCPRCCKWNTLISAYVLNHVHCLPLGSWAQPLENDQHDDEDPVSHPELIPPNIDALLNGAVAPRPTGKATQSEISNWFEAPASTNQPWLVKVLMETPFSQHVHAEPEQEPVMLDESKMPSFLNPLVFGNPSQPWPTVHLPATH